MNFDEKTSKKREASVKERTPQKEGGFGWERKKRRKKKIPTVNPFCREKKKNSNRHFSVTAEFLDYVDQPNVIKIKMVGCQRKPHNVG